MNLLALVLVVTIMPSMWNGYKGTSIVSPGHLTRSACAEALKEFGPGNYTCRTSSKITITEEVASANSAALSWVAPTHNTDGSVLTNLDGYTLHYGQSPTALTRTIQITNSSRTSYVVSDLAPGTWYFALRACSTVCSDLSNIASKVIN